MKKKYTRQEARAKLRKIKPIEKIDKIKMYMDTVGTITNTTGKDKKYSGYFYRVGDVLTILVIASICGIQDVWEMVIFAKSSPVRKMLAEVYDIYLIPSYQQMLKMLSIIDTGQFNQAFIGWSKWLSEKELRRIIAIDGKSVKSTHKMSNTNSLHIVSAQISELGITIGQKGVQTKSNEIVAVRDLIELIDIKGNIVVADALSTQKKTVKLIVAKGADYVLPVKNNQEKLYNEIDKKYNIIKSIIQNTSKDEKLDKKLDYAEISEEKMNHGRAEKRVAYVYNNVDWLEMKDEWEKIQSIGIIETTFIENGKTVCFKRYYICSMIISAKELIRYTRSEWSVESMHWLLDVIYREDSCRLRDDNAQKNLNIVRKVALNIVRTYKLNVNSKQNISQIMKNCRYNPELIPEVLGLRNW